jgi:uncharacterized DUF497 family protein
MIISLVGLPFIVHSPSLFEMVSDRPDKVYIMYEQPSWVLVYRAEDGHTVSRTFRTRDDAARIISERRAQA